MERSLLTQLETAAPFGRTCLAIHTCDILTHITANVHKKTRDREGAQDSLPEQTVCFPPKKKFTAYFWGI